MTNSRTTLLFIHGAADLYGSDITLSQLVSGLDQERYRAIVVVPYHGPLVYSLQEAGAEVVVLPELPVLRREHMNITGLARLLVDSFSAIPKLMCLIRARDVTLVHSNTLAVVIPGLAAFLMRRPHVWHVHEILTRPRAVASLLATASSSLSTLVIANSRATADHYRRTRLMNSTPIKVILNGVDQTRVLYSREESLRSLVGSQSNDVIFALIGRVNHLKGHSVFLDAAELLAKECDRARFLIVGDSFTGQEHLSEAVDQRIKSSNILNGRTIRLPHMDNVGRIYSACDSVVVPSVDPESFGLIAAEAMAAGLPVIASRIGALPEVIDDECTGILVEPNDSESLLAAMRELMASPSLRAAMGREGERRFYRFFGVERYVKEFEHTYADLLAGNETEERRA